MSQRRNAHRPRTTEDAAATTPSRTLPPPETESTRRADPEPGAFDDVRFREWHLAATPHDAATTDFEWTIMRFQQAFERWVLELGAVTGMGELSYPENVILHVVAMQRRPKSAAAIARQLNREDIPNLQYCLRKLEKSDLVRKASGNSAKSAVYEVTTEGHRLVTNFARMREEILTAQTRSIDQIDARLRDATRLISLLTGLYDEAARVTATYSELDDPV